MIEYLKGVFQAVFDWLVMVDRKIDEIQVEFEEVAEDVMDKAIDAKNTIDDRVDDIQEDLEEARSMFDKAKEEEK